MAQYQRGAVVTPKASTRGTVAVYKRRVTQSIKSSGAGTVKAGTRTVTQAIKVSSFGTIAVGTRGMGVAAKVTAVSVAAYTRRIVEPASSFDGPREKPAKNEVNYADPWGNFHFALYLGDSKEPVAHFMEVSGLKNSSAPYEIQEGGLNGRSHKRVGQGKWENIVLRYASSASNELANWRNQYLLDENMTKGLRTEAKTSSGAIVLLNNAGEPIRRYEFEGAWPVSWEGPSLSSGGSALALESLEIAHNGLSIKEP